MIENVKLNPALLSGRRSSIKEKHLRATSKDGEDSAASDSLLLPLGSDTLRVLSFALLEGRDHARILSAKCPAGLNVLRIPSLVRVLISKLEHTIY